MIAMHYLIELRRRLLYGLIIIGVLWFILLPFSNKLYHFLAIPLLKQLPNHSNLIATNITATFFVPMKFAGITALMISVPFWLYQLWRFIMPALYQRERRWLWTFLMGGTVLFYAGMLFAYFVVFPLLFRFLVQTTPVSVTLLPDISTYLSIALQLLIAFGLSFEVPIIIVILIVTGITSIESMKQKRRYFIVAAFIVAMFLTPPDVVSQTLLAVPLCLLFEMGLWVSSVIVGRRNLTHY